MEPLIATALVLAVGHFTQFTFGFFMGKLNERHCAASEANKAQKSKGKVVKKNATEEKRL